MADTILVYLNKTDPRLPTERRALVAATAAENDRRTIPGNSTNTVLRDASYFLITYWSSQQSNPVQAALSTFADVAVLGLVYEPYKEIIQNAPQQVRQQLQRQIQTDNNPASAPGGFFWAVAGAEAGLAQRLPLTKDSWGVLPTNPIRPLPPTDAGPSASNSKGGTFLGPIGVNGFGTTQPMFLDPAPLGYSYRVIDSTTHFKSIFLPVGLALRGGDVFVSYDGHIEALKAGDLFDFLTHGFPFGVDQFSILGLDASDGLDTIDGVQFVVGLAFTEPADLAYISVDVVTPEPTTLLLWGTTMAGLGLARWRRRRSGRM